MKIIIHSFLFCFVLISFSCKENDKKELEILKYTSKGIENIKFDNDYYSLPSKDKNTLRLKNKNTIILNNIPVYFNNKESFEYFKFRKDDFGVYTISVTYYNYGSNEVYKSIKKIYSKYLKDKEVYFIIFHDLKYDELPFLVKSNDPIKL